MPRPGGSAMHYYSTRGQDGPLGFEDALLSGLARDGGLYLPAEWPQFTEVDISAMQGLSYAELAGRIMVPFCDGEVDEAELTAMAQDAYAGFDHPDIAPLVPLQDNLHVLELFHGPTIAKIASRHRKCDLACRRAKPQCGGKIIHNLWHQPRPVNRINRR